MLPYSGRGVHVFGAPGAEGAGPRGRRPSGDSGGRPYPWPVDPHDALTLARGLMEAHGVGDWELALDRARRRAGQTDHARRRITLSRPLTALYSPSEVRETVLHEIAHARVGPAHGHDAVWAAEARRLGASGRRLVAADAPSLPGRWVGICPAGHTVDRMRRPRRPMSCARCGGRFDPAHLMRWELDGVPVAPGRIGAEYERALRRLGGEASPAGSVAAGSGLRRGLHRTEPREAVGPTEETR
ncbi:hypothetical protein CHIBA101_0287 [Actinomyces sp. Chiba101]|nr:hypothetical protein CHIBA101_0287 [Actinomyces sp. Chiba101]SUU10980.1 SprT-like family [Actinomyces denticolens]